MPSIFQTSGSMPASWSSRDAAAHQRRPELGLVAVLVAVDRPRGARWSAGTISSQRSLRPVSVSQVERRCSSAIECALCGGVAVRVVADEHLHERRVEGLDVRRRSRRRTRARSGASAAALGRHRADPAVGPGAAGHVGPELLVDEDAGAVRRRAQLERPGEPVGDQRTSPSVIRGRLGGRRVGRRRRRPQ